MVMVAGVAHCPEVGVNVYVVVAVLFTAGDQLPAIAGAFEDEAGNEIVPPEQIGAIWLNVVTVGWLTTTVVVAVVAHCPALGVNVYVVVAVLFIAGDQVPVIDGTLVEDPGRLNAVPLQMGAIGLNVGSTGWLTVTDIVVVFAHWPAEGVKV
jgi:hypothetical protein